MKIVGNRKMTSLKIALFAGAAGLCPLQPAWSQEVVSRPADNDGVGSTVAKTTPDAEPGSEIVVTGTLIRGIAPVGTNVIGISSKAITRSGAVNAQQLLAQVPQVSNFFNGTPSASSDFTFPTTTPVIRNLPGINSTLTLLNGHRLVNIGILQAAGDPGVLPVSVMERVEVVPDGGS
ncbi:MAG TPA: TonB-dependent receptor plug domain-containing protein, partial [Sphingomicrobium sp.]